MQDAWNKLTPEIARLVRNLLTPLFIAIGFKPTEQAAGEIAAAVATIIVLGVQIWWSRRDDAKRAARAAKNTGASPRVGASTDASTKPR